MEFQRSNFVVRLHQILSGECPAPPFQLNDLPPSEIKAFINAVINSPLHDIHLALSGFQWEYSKGNYHHWRALFLHFDLYFKTYLSTRKDLLLEDDMVAIDVFPKNIVLQILRVMQIIPENCHNKSSFCGLEHFQLLLSSTDPEILIATLNTLSALVESKSFKIRCSGFDCKSINHHLVSLAQGWGSKEEGLGLFSCVLANEEKHHRQQPLLCKDFNDFCSNSETPKGSTLHFEFHSTNPSCDEISTSTANGSASNTHIIFTPDLHLQKEDDLTLLKQYIDKHDVPLEHRFPLLTRIRYAHAFLSSKTHSLYSQVCILAFIVLVQSKDAQVLSSFFANEPEYTNELIRLVHANHFVPDIIKALSVFALTAIIATYDYSYDKAISGYNIISAGENRTVLLTVLVETDLSLNSRTDPLLVEAVLHFFLIYVWCCPFHESEIVPLMVALLKSTDPAHLHLVRSALKTLRKLMADSLLAIHIFEDLEGVKHLVHRLHIEVHRVTDISYESSSALMIHDSIKSAVKHLCAQRRLIYALLKAYSPANLSRPQDPHYSSLFGLYL